MIILEKLAKDFPRDSQYRVWLARDYNHLGALLMEVGRLSEAEIHFQRSVAELEELATEDPGEPEYRLNWGTSLLNLGAVHRDTGRYQEAENELRQAFTIIRKAASGRPKIAECAHRLAEVLSARAQLCCDHEDLADARRLFAEALGHQKTAVELGGKTSPAYQGRVAIYCLQLAETLLHMPQDPALQDQIQELLREAVHCSAEDRSAQNALAWFLATCCQPCFRDPKRAAVLAKNLIEKAPQKGAYWRTLGAANHGMEDWKGAVAAMEKAMDLRNGGDGTEPFFIAMGYWRMGNHQDARTSYDQAVRRMEKHNPHDYERRRFRAEAAALLNLEE
jgi:tetratricopeptide (TPR) repeat protein